ncbi:hypothetical protein, partial [Azotobacter beijerinckii]
MSLPLLVALPAALETLASRALEAFEHAAGALGEAPAQAFSGWPEARRAAFARVCANSEFVAEQALRD